MDYKISIPKPCHEDWNAMTPNDQGRFCMQCAKTVTDFTGMSALDIQTYLLENSGQKVCGRFSPAQLETITIAIPEQVLYTQTKFRNIFLLALLITMGTTLFSCNNGEKINEVTIEKDTIAIDSSDVGRKEMHHTLGVTIIDDSLPPSPESKSCGPVKGKLEISKYGRNTSKEVYLNGAVAIDPVPPPPPEIMGDIAVSPKTDSVPPPPKVQTVPAPKSNPEDIKFRE